MRGGWYLMAFESELTGDISPVDLDGTPLILVDDGDRVRAFDAVCPHQGAHLGHGGRLEGRGIVCPFHGKRIALGTQAGTEYCVQEYPTLGYGGMVFVRPQEQHEKGLGALLESLVADHVFVPFHCTPLAAAGQLVIENAFDATHFRPVHGTSRNPRFAASRTGEGAFVAEGVLQVPPTPWYRGDSDGLLQVPFRACAVSPHLVLTYLGGNDPYWVITATTPTVGGCLVRQALALPCADGTMPEPDRVAYLARASKGGLEQDRVIWENLHAPAHPRYGPEDATLREFREFCLQFDGAGAGLQ